MTGGPEPQGAGQVKGNEGRLLLEPALTASYRLMRQIVPS